MFTKTSDDKRFAKLKTDILKSQKKINVKQFFDYLLSNIPQIKCAEFDTWLSVLCSIESIEMDDDNHFPHRNTYTASIEKTKTGHKIKFCSNFFEKLTTNDDLLFVILHELEHKIRGDFHRPCPMQVFVYKYIWESVFNLATDLMIDAYLYKKLFNNPSPPILKQLYKKKKLFSTLLCPPDIFFGPKSVEDPNPGHLFPPTGKDNLSRQNRREGEGEQKSIARLNSCYTVSMNRIKSVFKNKVVKFLMSKDIKNDNIYKSVDIDNKKVRELTAKVSTLYYNVWFDVISFEELMVCLIDFIRCAYSEIKWADDLCIRTSDIDYTCIGDHPYYHELDDYWSKWIRGKGVGAGVRNVITNTSIKVEEKKKKCQPLYNAIKAAMTKDGFAVTKHQTVVPETGVVPILGRKETFYVSGGYLPTFYQNCVERVDYTEVSVRVYLDVSGSVIRELPLIYGLLVYAKDTISFPIYTFSNKIEEATLEDIKAGSINTTYGTDFNCVFEHALEHRFRRILIITDGHADLKQYLADEVIKTGLQPFVLFTDFVVGESGLNKLFDIEREKNKRCWQFNDYINDFDM